MVQATYRHIVNRVCIVTGCLVALALPTSHSRANEESDAVAQIKNLDGTAQHIGEGWEVDFHLRGHGLTDEGLVHVAALKNVTWLNLKGTQITGAGLAHLAVLENLRWLHLEETVVGDAGLEHLAALPHLEYLNLYGTRVTDKGLEHLAGAKNLRRLYLWRTDVTDEGAARLQAALPELKIVRGVDLSKLPAEFPAASDKPNPKPALKLDWVAVSRRGDAPVRSENGINCTVFFENQSDKPVKLYWISYGNGALKIYATLAPGETREQNSYYRNAWLITTDNDQSLGYFVVKEDDAHAIIPSQG